MKISREIELIRPLAKETDQIIIDGSIATDIICSIGKKDGVTCSGYDYTKQDRDKKYLVDKGLMTSPSITLESSGSFFGIYDARRDPHIEIGYGGNRSGGVLVCKSTGYSDLGEITCKPYPHACASVTYKSPGIRDGILDDLEPTMGSGAASKHDDVENGKLKSRVLVTSGALNDAFVNASWKAKREGIKALNQQINFVIAEDKEKIARAIKVPVTDISTTVKNSCK